MGRPSASGSHYDRVTPAWRLIMGDYFHFGLFQKPDDSMEQAAERLIDSLAGLTSIVADAHILDVGCGTGMTAMRLHGKSGCRVMGISNSAMGVRTARATGRVMGMEKEVAFMEADALDNGLDAAAFDIVWVMEMSHLIGNKTKLIHECGRVLKPGGTLLLCDVMRTDGNGFGDTLRCLARMKKRHILRMRSIIRAFGNVHTEGFKRYGRILTACGIREFHCEDVGKQVIPTFSRWRMNLDANREAILEYLTEREMRDFTIATEILEHYFREGLLGYGLIGARKASVANDHD